MEPDTPASVELTAIFPPAKSASPMGFADQQLQPLPYHEALAGYLQTHEKEVWKWMSDSQAKADYAEELRLELLKHTYRLEPTSHPEVFAALERAKAVHCPEATVALYQSQHSHSLNAEIYFLPGEAHVVFVGNVLQLLTPAELLAVLGHELAHYRLWQVDGGRYFVADRVTQAMAADPRATNSHLETARLWRLYTEIYADCGSLAVTGDVAPVVSGLVKLATGLAQVDPAAYMQQAEEIFARTKIRTESVSHPETFIRTRAARLRHEAHPELEREVGRMIEGEARLDRLDLLGQAHHAALTRRWFDALLAQPELQTDATRAQARLFFPDFEFPTGAPDPNLPADLAEAADSVRDYFCYLLLDFSLADPELEEEPMKAGYRLAQRCGWAERLEALAVKELKFKKRDAKRQREEALAGAEGSQPA
jgi:hypothetical protein